jgi:hypothetical protein
MNADKTGLDFEIAAGTERDLGIRSSGVILKGEVELREALVAEGRRAMRARRECYGSVADYDPVLRYHCRL